VFIGFESCLPERCRRQTQTNPLLGSLPAAPAPPPAARGDSHRRPPDAPGIAPAEREAQDRAEIFELA